MQTLAEIQEIKAQASYAVKATYNGGSDGLCREESLLVMNGVPFLVADYGSLRIQVSEIDSVVEQWCLSGFYVLFTKS